MAYAERIHPPLSRNMLTEELNRIRPALSRDSLPDMRESVMPALSDRLLNAPEATSVPQHHQAQRIPPRRRCRSIRRCAWCSRRCRIGRLRRRCKCPVSRCSRPCSRPAPDAADAYARCARAENGAAFAGERVCADSVRFRVACERFPMRCGCVGVSAGRKRACAV